MKNPRIFAIFAMLIIGVASFWMSKVHSRGESGNRFQAGDSDHIETAPPSGVDLDVTYISRTPLYNPYCVEFPWDVLNQPGIPYLCPGSETDQRWPNPGEIVTFTAHIINKGTEASPIFDYAWMIDEVQVSTGSLNSLEPSAEITVTYQWVWGHGLSPDGQQALGEHTVGFIVDPTNEISETYETNNQLQDYTQAMSFNITLTPEMYQAYNIPIEPVYPYSAEDWLQKQIKAMNDSFEQAQYPATPEGAALRVRINNIVISPTPPDPDGLHDGGWFINTEVRCVGCGYYDPITDIDWGLVHELSHQVSLIDLYAIGVYAANVFVTDKTGNPAKVSFGWAQGGLMGGGDISPYPNSNRYSSHSAGGANTFAGYRNGYYGVYLFDIPLDNYLQVLNNQGNPASQVEIDIYQRTGPWDWTGQMGVDNTVEISGTTDTEGIFHLPNRSTEGGTTTLNNHTLHDNPFSVVDVIGNQGLLLLKLTQDNHEEFHWLDITQFNLAYWNGDIISHTFTISSQVPPPGAPTPPEILSARFEGSRTSLEWTTSPSDEIAGYHVYRATPPQYTYQLVSDLLLNTNFEEYFWGYDGSSRLYAVTALDSGGLESGFAELVYAPSFGNPVEVTALPSGDSVVLDNLNMYPLLQRNPSGRYTHQLSNVHYDLGNTRFMDLDPLGRTLLAGFGEFPDERAAVRIFSDEMSPLWAFGEQGSETGQFDTPAGIDWWGPACPFAVEPFVLDDHTTFLAHFDGEYTGVQGEVGTPIGTSFESGWDGQGVFLDDIDTLTYSTVGNIQSDQGALEFWVRPQWDGNDGGNHTLFWWGGGDDFFHLRKDGISNLVFDVFYTGGSCGAPLNVASWKAGEWHHLGVSWKDTMISLFVDGQRVKKSTCDGMAQPTAEVFFIGSGSSGDLSIEATIDEFRISDIPRVGINEPCGRILIADSANHRIQAFEAQGHLISSFGSFGSGAGHFNSPQGVAVDSAGRVLIIDQGNNRLVVLAFDGSNLSYLESYSAGLNSPSGLAVDLWDNIYIADTGNNRIVMLDQYGNFLTEYLRPNDGSAGNFNSPQGIAVARNGDILVADTGNRRVCAIQFNNIYFPILWR